MLELCSINVFWDPIQTRNDNRSMQQWKIPRASQTDAIFVDIDVIDFFLSPCVIKSVIFVDIDVSVRIHSINCRFFSLLHVLLNQLRTATV